MAASWYQGLYSAVSKVVGGLWPRLGGQGWTRFRFLLPGSRFDYEREAGDLWQNPVVGLAIDWLGNRFPRPILHVSRVKRSGDFEPLGRHPLTDLWNRPNEAYSRRTLEKAIGLSLKCDGNAYLYKVRDNGGRPVELWWVPHYRILPTWPPDGSAFIDGYRVWVDTQVYWLPRADVIHIRDGIDPRNERLGLCALRSTIREICTINDESAYRAALLRNSGVPSLAVVPRVEDLRPDREAADEIRADFLDRFGGDNRGSTAVLGGMYDLVKVGFSPEELNLIDLPVIPTARILAAMGVAPMSLGLPDPGKTYANLQEANRSSWGTIVATQELVAESLRWELLPEFGDDPNALTCEYDYTHIQELQEALDAIHARTREDWKAGVIQLNEAREQIGFDPTPDGDRWFPGTGDPAEAERQDQQHEERLAVLKNRPGLPAPGKNGKQEEGDELDLDPEEKRWVTIEGRHVFVGRGGQVMPHGPGTKPVATVGIHHPDTRHKPSANGHGGGGSGSSRSAEKPSGELAGSPTSKTAGRGEQASGKDMAGKNDKEIADHHKNMDADWRKGLSESEHQAVRIYTGESFGPLNSSLRNPKTAKQSANSELVRNVDKAIGKSSLKEDTVVYRGIKDPASLGLHPDKAIGASIKDPGFLSTSINPKVAHKYAGDSGAVLKISAPKGSKGASMGGISRYPKEHEVLFARNSGYKITGVSKEGGRTVYHAELTQGH